MAGKPWGVSGGNRRVRISLRPADWASWVSLEVTPDEAEQIAKSLYAMARRQKHWNNIKGYSK